MFQLTDSTGRPLFECISISLVCDDCLKTDFPEKCTHKLASMPRWLSSAKMEVVKSLLSEDPAMLLRESMGVAADQSCKAFPSADVDKFLARPGLRIFCDEYEPLSRTNTRHFIVSVDPAGGGASAFAVSSMAQLPNGGVVVRASFFHRVVAQLLTTPHLAQNKRGHHIVIWPLTEMPHKQRRDHWKYPIPEIHGCVFIIVEMIGHLHVSA